MILTTISQHAAHLQTMTTHYCLLSRILNGISLQLSSQLDLHPRTKCTVQTPGGTTADTYSKHWLHDGEFPDNQYLMHVDWCSWEWGQRSPEALKC